MTSPMNGTPSRLAPLFKSVAGIEPYELKSVILSVLFFFFLFGSYSVVKPVRGAMGTVYGIAHLQELWTATLVASFLFAPLYAALASRIRLSHFLPWVYGPLLVLSNGAAATFDFFPGGSSRTRFTPRIMM